MGKQTQLEDRNQWVQRQDIGNDWEQSMVVGPKSLNLCLFTCLYEQNLMPFKLANAQGLLWGVMSLVNHIIPAKATVDWSQVCFRVENCLLLKWIIHWLASFDRFPYPLHESKLTELEKIGFQVHPMFQHIKQKLVILFNNRDIIIKALIVVMNSRGGVTYCMLKHAIACIDVRQSLQ